MSQSAAAFMVGGAELDVLVTDAVVKRPVRERKARLKQRHGDDKDRDRARREDGVAPEGFLHA